VTAPRIVLGCDPGNNTGIAWFLDGRLFACYLAAPGDELVVPALLYRRTPLGPSTELDGAAHAVFELPKFYPPKTYGSPAKAYNVGNSLIRESVTLGEWKHQARRLGMTLEEVLPRTWKGTMPKRAMLACIVKSLDVNERALVRALGLPASLVHNVLDAIGIGLWSCNRLDVRRFAK
jgi:hypothetical protein